MNLLDHALRLAAHGFHVFPLVPDTKDAWLPGYPEKASLDPDQLRRWWLDPVLELAQPYNPAISTTRYGIADEPLVAIDVDVKADKGGHFSLEDLEARGLILPPTFSQSTPTGGRHFIYRTVSPLRQIVSSKDKPGPLGPGIDTRSRGGYVVGAGAIVPAGEYSADWLPVAEAPDWLIELLGPAPDRELSPAAPSPVNQEHAEAAARRYLEVDAPIAVKGKGGDATTLAVAMQVKDLGVADPALCLRLMLEVWNPRSPPGWAAEKLKRKVANAYRYGRRAVGASSAEVLLAGAGESESADHLPAIRFGMRQLRDEVDDAWQAIRRANGSAPSIFQRCGRLDQARLNDERGPAIERMERDWLAGHLSRIANWLRQLPKSLRNGYPPEAVARDMIARPVDDLPALEAAGTEPVFTAAGRLVTAEGYDAEAAYYLHGNGGAALDGIPEEPTDEELAAARGLLLDHLLEGFPFVSDADRAHAVAALLLPLVRRMISGPTPLHAIEAPVQDTGKTLLAQAITLVATGRVAAALPFPTSEEEWSKTITTVLLEAKPAVLLDNAPERIQLRSPSLAVVLSSELVTGRLLGKNEAPTLLNRSLWLMTGNNPRFDGDWSHRCVRIRINADAADPGARPAGEYRHPELLAWAAAERGDLLRALAVLVMGWLARGRPSPGIRFGKFDSWSVVIGGILEVAGVPGFLANRAEMLDTADTEAGEWTELVDVWWLAHDTNPVTVAEVADLADQAGLLVDVLGSGNALSRQSRMGRALGSNRDRIFGTCRVQRIPSHTHKTRYQLVPVGGVYG